MYAHTFSSCTRGDDAECQTELRRWHGTQNSRRVVARRMTGHAMARKAGHTPAERGDHY